MSGGLHFCQMSAEDYLELPRIKASLAAADAKVKGKGSMSTGDDPVAAVHHPLQLGEPTPSSFHTAELNQLCQKLAIAPEYDFEGDHLEGWGACLRLGNCKIMKNGMRWQTKRAAKDALAELGLEAMAGMASGQNKMLQTRNWPGLLHEFYTKSFSIDFGGPVYTEYTVGSCFACTCTIPARSEPFGSAFSSFPSKKAARASVAMEAMQFLIDQGLANSEGKDIRTAKKGSKEKLEAILLSNSSSYTQKVHELCPLLGLPQPLYRLASDADGPMVNNILSGAAYFPNSPLPLLSGPVGTIRNVFGKKNAKEECARELYTVLIQIATGEEGPFFLT